MSTIATTVARTARPDATPIANHVATGERASTEHREGHERMRAAVLLVQEGRQQPATESQCCDEGCRRPAGVSSRSGRIDEDRHAAGDEQCPGYVEVRL
jgi:hypothetical protein